MTVYRWLLSGALGALALLMLDPAEKAFLHHDWWLFAILAAGVVVFWSAVQFTIPPRIVEFRVVARDSGP